MGNNVVLWVLFALCCVLECVFTPLFLKAQWPQKTRKSLILKMTCSTLFVAVGVLSVFLAGNTTRYAVLMLVALCFGWAGDYFLHAKPTNAYFISGAAGFLVGHVLFIVAYLHALKGYGAERFLSVWHVIGAVAVLGTAIAIAVKMRIKFTPAALKYGILVYAIILTFMFLKATELGCRAFSASGNVLPLLVLSFGSLFFLLSDSSLGVILFCGQKENRPLKVFNIVTYFAGQILLASSILFIFA